MGVYYIHHGLLCLCMHYCLIIALVYKYSAMTLSSQIFLLLDSSIFIIHQPLFILGVQIHIKPVRDTLLLEDDCSPDQSTTTWAAW